VRSLQSGSVDAVLIAAQKGAAWTVLVWDLWIRYANADQLPEQLFRHWVEGLPAAGARS